MFQGSEIYGGLAGTWDYGPLGLALKKNIENAWWQMFVESREDMYGIDAAILMHSKVWEASGHVAGFSDPIVECNKCHERYRLDHLEGLDDRQCPACGEMNALGQPRQFNMMFKTHIGTSKDESNVSYLRPETAGGMFVNYKNIMDSIHPKLPFGLAQIGKAFRNEIAPRDFVFRSREFEQMEVEYFVRPSEWEKSFEDWRKTIVSFIEAVGVDANRVHELDVQAEDRAHYSKKTTDFEFDFPFGRKELYGLAYRTDFDLTAHQQTSGQDLGYLDEETKERFIPHVIEPSLGVDRTILAVLVSAYHEDELGGEKRVYLALKPAVAPVKAAVFPLLKNKPELVARAREIFVALKKEIPQVVWDDNGNIGKRYRRQDEIGTPFCITVDFDTLGDGTVTLRDRDSGKQERIASSELAMIIKEKIETPQI